MARRDEVLDAALALAVEEGTYGLTHRKIDARAGVPQGTTANYFPNRVALVRAILAVVTDHHGEFTSRPVEYDGSVDAEDLLLAWLRRRVGFMLGPGRLHATAYYRFTIDGTAVPEIRAEVAAARARLFDDCKSIVVRCGSLDPERHAAWLRSFIGGIVGGSHLFPFPDFDLDGVLRPMARGLVQVMRRDAHG